jgi:hypothetical protein
MTVVPQTWQENYIYLTSFSHPCPALTQRLFIVKKNKTVFVDFLWIFTWTWFVCRIILCRQLCKTAHWYRCNTAWLSLEFEVTSNSRSAFLVFTIMRIVMKRSTVWLCLKFTWIMYSFCIIKLLDKYAQNNKEALPVYYNYGNDRIKCVIVHGVPQVSARSASVQSVNVRRQWRPTEACSLLL